MRNLRKNRAKTCLFAFRKVSKIGKKGTLFLRSGFQNAMVPAHLTYGSYSDTLYCDKLLLFF